MQAFLKLAIQLCKLMDWSYLLEFTPNEAKTSTSPLHTNALVILVGIYP
uniref:Uncharacterized protein n=1 Tax=Rhizophora mucronata TaxID=61149 RepID=A0A2P2QH89_RHIMU